jgi:hypothetical protein
MAEATISATWSLPALLPPSFVLSIGRSQSLVYSTGSRWRRIVSLGWNRAVFWQQRHNSLLRLSIHPSDISHPRIWRQILRFVDRALADRTPVTYRSWIVANQATTKNPES